MKKIISLLLVLSMIFLCGCSQTNKKTAVLSPEMKEYLSTIHNFEGSVHEYAEERSNLFFGEKLVAGVFYPHVGIEEMDSVIEAWVTDLISEYQQEVALNSDKEFENASELTVIYDSYLIDDKYISVKMTGFFDSPLLAHPVEIVKTFNGDIEKSEYLSLEDIVGKKGASYLESSIVSGNSDIRNVDENLLNNWLMTKEGIDIILSQGDYLPMSDGTKTISFEYEQLNDFMNDKADAEESQQVGNEADADKNEVEAAGAPNKQTVDKSKPMIALTFDDGPSAHTDMLLDIFAENGGKGTFFVVGNILDNRPDTVKRIVNDGHEIAGHSWSHRQLTSLGEKEIKDQIMTTRAKIFELTGVDATLMRPPYGAVNDTVKNVAATLEVALINWSVDTLDWKYRNADTVYKSVMDQACDGAIILCHDLHKTTVEAMEKAIPALLEEGYQLVTVSELMEAKGKEIIPGKVYYQG